MSFDREHLYLTWGGQIGQATGSPEVWMCGLRMALTTNAFVPPSPDDAQTEALFTIFANYHKAAANEIYPGALMQWVKVAHVDENGAYTDNPKIHEGPVQAGGYGGGQTGATPQDSLVVTLWSGQTLGSGNRSRFYLPWQCSTLDAQTAVVGTAVQTDVANRAKTLVNDLNAWGATLPGTHKPVVSIMSKVGTGSTKVPQFVRVGAVKDTQRRRRNRLNEAYHQVAI